MLKYSLVVCFLVAFGTSIVLIDVRSNGLAGPKLEISTGSGTARVISAMGIVEGATEAIELQAEVPARVREVLVKPGDWVESGEVLVRLDDAAAQQESALAAAKLELAKAEHERLINGARPEERYERRALVRGAKARLDQAVRSLERLKGLQATRAATDQEVEDQQASVDTSMAELEAAEARARQLEAPARLDEVRAAKARIAAADAEFKLAKVRLSKFDITAPCSGRVLDVHVEAGELTSPAPPKPLVMLTDTSVVRVRAFVEELDAPHVRVGMPAQVTVDGLGNEQFRGRVTTIHPAMAHKERPSDRRSELYDTKVREVLVDLPDAPGLVVGLQVDVELTYQASPSSAASINNR